jgi:hypothetical protein
VLQAAPLAAFTQLVGYRLTDSHTGIATAPYLLETPATFVRLVRSVAAHAAAQGAAGQPAAASPVLAVRQAPRPARQAPRPAPGAIVAHGRASLRSSFGHSPLSADGATGPPRGGSHSPRVQISDAAGCHHMV